MTAALIGPGGFVGSNLARQRRFDAQFGRANISAIRGQKFNTIVCAGVRAEKWKANADPADDRAGIAALTGPLLEAKADHLILISTVDVFAMPMDVNESTPVDPLQASAYGRHRYELELLLREHFPRVTVVRLPGLFGPGLKKNVIFDLLHGNRVEMIHPGGIFQYYSLDRLADDIDHVVDRDIPLMHLVTEPIRTAELAEVAFGQPLPMNPTPAGRYDIRTQYAHHWGRGDGYILSRSQVLQQLCRFVAQHPKRCAA
jgi:nucleoside-diphosphate-sugar epimerase